jgi:DNA repair protein RadC
MNYYKALDSKKLELLEGGVEMKRQPAKRVNIVSLRLVRESSLLYKNRHIRSPRDSYDLIRTFIEDADLKCSFACR